MTFNIATKATGYSELRYYQGKTIQEYLSCGGMFVSAPTGAGKSLAFELAPYAFDQRGPVRGGAHVLRLNFTARYVAISEHSCVACRNFINKF